MLGSVMWCYVILSEAERHPLKDVLCAARIADNIGPRHTHHWRLSRGLSLGCLPVNMFGDGKYRMLHLG